MLTFRNTNICCTSLLLILVGYHVYAGVPWFVYALLLFVYSMVVFYGCYAIQSQFFLPVFCFADTEKKQIAISFDDGPAQQFTGELLSLLKEQNTTAAFFCIGKNISENEALLQQVHQQGHLLGNHSFSHHFWFDLFSAAKMLADMQHAGAEVERVAGVKPRLFRPPYGVINPNLKKAIIAGGYTTIGWNVRSMDTVTKDEKQLLHKVKRSLKPGAIFLFHDTSKTTLAILPTFIQWVKQEGYDIVRLDKMLNLEAYA